MRLIKLRETLTEKDLDAFLVSQPENRRYLSGFSGSAGWLLITAGRALLATDFRYYEQVGREAPDFELAQIKTKFSDLLPELLADLGVARLGFESQHVTVDQLDTWRHEVDGVEWVPLKDTVEGIRSIKDEAEPKLLLDRALPLDQKDDRQVSLNRRAGRYQTLRPLQLLERRQVALASELAPGLKPVGPDELLANPAVLGIDRQGLREVP